MCGIAGVISRSGAPIDRLRRRLEIMNDLQRHRGPDGEGVWEHPAGRVGLAHRRLSIIDLETGDQPMTDHQGNWIAYNGEIYNYLELRSELGVENFRTHSDTEVILHAYRRWGADCVNRFRGMFAFALWDEQNQRLFCARDRFGIKPFYYIETGDHIIFASEIKALLPFIEDISVDHEALKEYLTFQFCLEGRTLFRGVKELQPSHTWTFDMKTLEIRRYWEIYYNVDTSHTEAEAADRVRSMVEESVRYHLRSDVPVGAYLSGGLDSSIVSALASRISTDDFLGFTGRFDQGLEYDESRFARLLAERNSFSVMEHCITASDFMDNMRQVIYHLDCPVAGPGAFPQYMISRTASKHRKVVLGGQGGDEIFGGYTRYLIAYFEQCIKAAIDGTSHDGNFIVTYESIIPNLSSLRNYKPLLREFWRDGLFDPMDQRYFRLINRAPNLGPEIRWDVLGDYSPYDAYRRIFHGHNVGQHAYLDLMLHFDFKTLLPSLLQVEDRVSMAHGLESRVPLLDHELVEYVATLPASIKFKSGSAKHILKTAFEPLLPPEITARQDKMGFPIPFTEWLAHDIRDFVISVFRGSNAASREWANYDVVIDHLTEEKKYARNVWGLLSLELWAQEFLDRGPDFRRLMTDPAPAVSAIKR